MTRSTQIRTAVAYCLRPSHLRRTLITALTVGAILTAINQYEVIAGGRVTAGFWIKCGLNFVVPFVVSNIGLLAGRRG